VSGYLDSEIHFTDGQMVKKGDLLFTIDKPAVPDRARPANARQSRAGARQSRLHRGRSRARAQLVHNKTITEQTFDQRTQAKRVAEAAVAAQEAMVIRPSSTSTNITELRAPVDGRIGDRRVAVGNLVTGGTGGNTTLLATIVSVDPIRFEFTFDEASYLRYERLRKRASNDGEPHGTSRCRSS
jgi:multidrug efflux system membrane fusion protein